MKRILLSLFITSSVLAAHADEGMWMLTDLQKAERSSHDGTRTAHPHQPNLQSRRHCPEGCRGAFRRWLYRRSHLCRRPGTDQPPLRLWRHTATQLGGTRLPTDGFWAMSREEELPCKGLTVTYIDRILDVTDYVNEQLKTDDDPNGTNYLSPKYRRQ